MDQDQVTRANVLMAAATLYADLLVADLDYVNDPEAQSDLLNEENYAAASDGLTEALQALRDLVKA